MTATSEVAAEMTAENQYSLESSGFSCCSSLEASALADAGASRYMAIPYALAVRLRLSSRIGALTADFSL